MANITLAGKAIETIGTLPRVGEPAPAFTLTGTDLADVTQDDFADQRLVLNIFPSIDTPICAASVRRFNQEASTLADTVVLCISADLPFAHGRFCEAEGLNDVVPLSTVRSSFGKDYGLAIVNGPLAGFMSRAIVIIDQSGMVTYTEQVLEIKEDPDFEAALRHLRG